MSEDLKKTLRISRPPKVRTDDRGHTVWDDTVKTANLELVSTQMLKKVLDSDDGRQTEKIRQAAASKDGLLAHDPAVDGFEIIDDDDLKAILENDPKGLDAIKASELSVEALTEDDPDDESLSLVSTQMLRQILDPDAVDIDADERPPDGGFDPYNSG